MPARTQFFLYHSVSYSKEGKFQELIDSTKELGYIQKEMEEFVLERTNISQNKLEEIRKNKSDWSIHLDEAIELKIVTHLLKTP